jgi:hypothetical protein
MAAGTRRMRITTIETDKVTIIRRHVRHTWCRECSCEVEAVGIEGAQSTGRSDPTSTSELRSVPGMGDTGSHDWLCSGVKSWSNCQRRGLEVIGEAKGAGWRAEFLGI